LSFVYKTNFLFNFLPKQSICKRGVNNKFDILYSATFDLGGTKNFLN